MWEGSIISLIFGLVNRNRMVVMIKRLFPCESFIRKLPYSPRGKVVQGNVEARCVARQKL